MDTKLESISPSLKAGHGCPRQVCPHDEGKARLGSVLMPHISIVMPSYNQGAFIEKAIRSVLQQDYPNLELIVMDGGSTDGSVEVIRRYADCLAHWQSGPDGGQSQAINAGMERASGDLVAWLNSDDFYLPGAFQIVAEKWQAGHPRQWLVGVTDFCGEAGQVLYDWTPTPARNLGEALSQSPGVPQTSGFWDLALWREVGGLDESLHYCMDEDLFMKFYIAGARPLALPEHLAVMVVQRASKTCAQQSRFSRDYARIVLRHRRHVPRDEMSFWRAGVRRMAHNYGLQAWKCVSKGDALSTWDYVQSGTKLSPISMAWGVARGAGVAVKQRLRCDKEEAIASIPKV